MHRFGGEPRPTQRRFDGGGGLRSELEARHETALPKRRDQRGDVPVSRLSTGQRRGVVDESSCDPGVETRDERPDLHDQGTTAKVRDGKVLDLGIHGDGDLTLMTLPDALPPRAAREQPKLIRQGGQMPYIGASPSTKT